MKRTVYLVVLLMCFNFSSGQTNMFFQAGINCSMLQKPVITFDHTEFGSEFSYTFGTGIKSQLSSHFSCSLGLTYYNYETDVVISASSAGGYGDYNYDLNLGYISVSLLPEYYFGHKKTFFINAGSYFSIVTNSGINGSFNGGRADGYRFSHELIGNLNEELRNIDFGLLAGAGVRVMISEGFSMSPQLRYNFGLIGIEKPYAPDGGAVISACYQGRKMRALCLLVEFDFRIKK